MMSFNREMLRTAYMPRPDNATPEKLSNATERNRTSQYLAL
jgi:hypothetical protein